MKKIVQLYVIFTLSAMTSLLGQVHQTPQPNSTLLNSSLDKFVGKWQYVNNDDTVVIVLNKQTILLPIYENCYEEVIVGFHKYKKGNVIIESSLEYSLTAYSEKKSTILVSNRVGMDNGFFINGSLKDISRAKLVNVQINMNTAQNQLTIYLKNREGLKLGRFDWSFTLPTQFTANKVL